MFASLLVASPAKAAVTSTVISNATYPLGLDVDPDGNVWIGYADGSMTPKGVTVVPAASGSLFRVAVTAGVESLIFNLDGVQGILRAPSGHLFVSAGGNLYVATATNTTVFGVATTANTLTQLSSSGGVRVGGRRANPPTPFAHWLRSHPVPPQMWW
jgi:DNA-binding beta-propeller fold protein YncE